MPNALRKLVVLASGLFIFACAAAKPGEVQRAWVSTLREMGIHPVFPPREDVQVGDIYLRRLGPASFVENPSSGFVPIDLWVSSIPNTRDLLEQFQETRIAFPDSQNASESGQTASLARMTGRGLEDLAAHGHDSLFDFRDPTRTRQVAFPDFTSFSISGGNLQALVPIQALSLAFGSSWENQQQVNVKIPVAESYGLPARSALQSVLQLNPSGSYTLHSGLQLNPAFLQLMYRQNQSWLLNNPDLSSEQKDAAARERLVYLDVILEVYMTRSLEISISRAATGGARADLSSPGISNDGEVKSPATTQESEAGAVARANKLNERLHEVDDLSSVGGAVQFTAVSDHSISMRRNYQRPIALGFRSVILAVDPRTGEVRGVAAKSGVNPLAETTGGRLTEQMTPLLVTAVNDTLRGQLGLLDDVVTQASYSQENNRILFLFDAEVIAEDELNRQMDANRGVIISNLRNHAVDVPHEDVEQAVDLLQAGSYAFGEL